jgi:hypothetical protein
MLPGPPGACKVLSDSATALLGASESTGSCVGAFRILQDSTIRIVKGYSTWDLCTHLLETLGATGTNAQVSGRLWEQLRPLCKLCGRLLLVFVHTVVTLAAVRQALKTPPHRWEPPRWQSFPCATYHTSLRDSWCYMLTQVVVRVPQPQCISRIICVFDTVPTFATSKDGMYYLSLSIFIHMELQA